jgi:hypothetical protein
MIFLFLVKKAAKNNREGIQNGQILTMLHAGESTRNRFVEFSVSSESFERINAQIVLGAKCWHQHNTGLEHCVVN